MEDDKFATTFDQRKSDRLLANKSSKQLLTGSEATQFNILKNNSNSNSMSKSKGQDSMDEDLDPSSQSFCEIGEDSQHQASMLNMMNQPMPQIKSPHVLNKIKVPAT